MTLSTQPCRREFLKFLLAGSGLLAAAREARAHARMLRSEPKNGAVLHASPAQIDLWFNELLDADFHSFALFRANNESDKKSNLATEKPKLDPKDRTHLILPLAPLKPGAYTVEYRVLSRDGHTATGRLTFTLLPKSKG